MHSLKLGVRVTFREIARPVGLRLFSVSPLGGGGGFLPRGNHEPPLSPITIAPVLAWRGAAASAGTVLALLAGLIPAGVASVAAAAAFANRHRQAAAGVTFTDADPAGNLSQYAGSDQLGDGTTTTIPKSHFIAIPARLGGGFAAGDGTHMPTAAPTP